MATSGGAGRTLRGAQLWSQPRFGLLTAGNARLSAVTIARAHGQARRSSATRGRERAEFDLVIPGPMREVVDEWRAAGSPSQQGIEWPRDRWIVAFPPDAATFTTLPDRLDRIAVRHACVHAADSPADAERSFLAVMAWGYGRVGYGPFRVRRVLHAVSDAGPRLQAAASAAAQGHPVEAYSCLGDHGTARLPHLGPAFGTKFLYFCSSAERRPALILDRLVARWLPRTSASSSTNSGGPSPPTGATSRRCSDGLTNWPSAPTSSRPASFPHRLASAIASGLPADSTSDAACSGGDCGAPGREHLMKPPLSRYSVKASFVQLARRTHRIATCSAIP
jgi:hypothetical protein